jgi:hypothetical protein
MIFQDIGMQSAGSSKLNNAHIGFSTRCTVLLACIIGVYLRVPDRFLNPQFWAEDGTIFFVQAVTGGIRSLFEPYAGSSYLYERIVALLAVQFNWAYAPAIYMGFAWLAFATTTLWCLSDRLPFVKLTRIAMAACISFAAVKNETYLNLANSIWLTCGLGLLLLLMSRDPAKASQKVFDYSICLLLGLTGPFCVVYAPLFAIKAAVERNRHAFILLGLIALCCGVQVIFLPSRQYEIMGGPLNPSIAQFLSVLDFRFLWMFIGYNTMPFRTLNLWVAAPLLAGIVLIFSVTIWQNYREGGFVRMVPLLACALVIAAVVIQYREMPEALVNAARYFFVPIVTFLWGLVLAAERKPLFFAPLVVLSFVAFLSHPAWDEYAMPDLNWREYADCLRTNPECVAPVHPAGFGLSISLPTATGLVSAKEISDRMRANAGRMTRLAK